ADELRSLADDFLAPKLRLVPGIGRAEVSGGTERELRITLDPSKLATYQLTPYDVQQVLLESISDEVYGRLRVKGRDFLLMTPSEQLFQNLAALPLAPKTFINTAPHPIPLSEVAILQIQDAPIRSISRIDGQQVVSLQLSRTPGSHLLQTAESVRFALVNFKNKLPHSVRILIADDRSENVQKELNNLAWQGSIGFFLVVLVLIFMLKSLRMVAVVLFSVFWAFAVSFLLLTPLGLSLNLVTLGGLVLVFGMLADNAVVVVVEWTRLRRPEKPLDETVKEVLGAVWMPLLGGTLTTCVVVLPLVYLSGAMQKLFLPFGVLTALTLIASLVSATLIVPVLGRFLPDRQDFLKKRPTKKSLPAFSILPYWFAGAFPRFSLLLLILGFGLPTWLLPDNLNIPINTSPDTPETRLRALYNETIGSDAMLDLRYTLDPYIGGLARIFFQKITFGQSWKYEESQEVFVNLSFPPGNPIARSDSLIQQFEQIALSNKAVKQTIVHASQSTAFLNVKFHENMTNPVEPFVVREDLIQQAVLLSGIGVSVSGLISDGYYNDFRRNTNGMRVDAYGSNYEDLNSFVNVFAERLKQNVRVVEVDTDAGGFDQDEKRSFLRFKWTPEAQMQTQISTQTLASALSPIFASHSPIGFADLNGENRLPIRMLMANLPETDVARLSEIPLPITPNKSISLGKTT
ncbi:MAG TPA: efflux RND transporter permease subunit, partial [Rhodothermales bacterium]|nr:efflux RND transporter permease subunit [Rhodothermales bacterium]